MLDLNALRQQEKVTILDLLSDSDAPLYGSGDAASSPSNSSSRNFVPWSALESRVRSLEQRGPFYLLIDDLDVFGMLAPTPMISAELLRSWIESVVSDNSGLQGIVVFGRQVMRETLSSVDKDSTKESSNNDFSSDQQINLAEYLKYR